MKDLNVAQKQLIEILKAISTNSRLIIMDEPTTALSLDEVNLLMKIIKELKKRGITIIYISHKMDEVFSVADEITVLRDGKSEGTYKKNDTTCEEIVSLMIGKKLSKVNETKKRKIGKPKLEVKNFTSGKLFENISFSVNSAEILGIYGLMGSGRTEVARSIFGLDKYDKGEIIIDGNKEIIKSPSDAIRLGLNYISEDRKEVGLVLSLSVKKNISLSNLRSCSIGPFLSEKKENLLVDEYIKKLSIKTTNSNQIVRNLSGGNQQKVIVAKALAAKSQIFIFDEPTKGIDVGAKREIYNLIFELKDNKKSIIVISSEVEEIIAISDRVLVFKKGRLCKELLDEDIKEEIIVNYAISS